MVPFTFRFSADQARQKKKEMKEVGEPENYHAPCTVRSDLASTVFLTPLSSDHQTPPCRHSVSIKEGNKSTLSVSGVVNCPVIEKRGIAGISMKSAYTINVTDTLTAVSSALHCTASWHALLWAQEVDVESVRQAQEDTIARTQEAVQVRCSHAACVSAPLHLRCQLLLIRNTVACLCHPCLPTLVLIYALPSNIVAGSCHPCCPHSCSLTGCAKGYCSILQCSRPLRNCRGQWQCWRQCLAIRSSSSSGAEAGELTGAWC